MSLFFEGNEKKVEVVVSAELGDLRNRGVEFWSEIVEAAGAKIISSLKSNDCDAYLLSESSLFVWSDRFTMITCGRTTLVKAIEAFLRTCCRSKIRSLIYERKNEYFPQLQHTDFFQDAKDLKTQFSGRAWQFGNTDEHHLNIFTYNTDFTPPSDDFTLEILMYDLKGVAREVFASDKESIESIRQKTGVHQILEGFAVDDYLFEPYGYSLNALKGDDYYTIHVTPQDVGTYVSFETNVNLQKSIVPTIDKVLKVFQPRRFDVVVFSPVALESPASIEGFAVKNLVQTQMEPGYFVSFSHHYTPLIKSVQPIEVEI